MSFRRLLCTFLIAAGAPTLAAAACTRDDAFNRMMALNQYGMKQQAALPDPLKDPAGYDAKFPRVTDFATRVAAVGQTLADQKWGEACAAYDAIARDYGVDYAAQNVRPLSAYEADARHPPQNRCDIAEASRRSVALTEAFRRKAEAEKLGREDWQQFGKDSEGAGLLMQRDAEKACRRLDDIAAKYGLKP
jgi:hypothetical protein